MYDIDISLIDYKNVKIKEYLDFVKSALEKHVSLLGKPKYKKASFSPSNNNNFKLFHEEIVPLMFFLQLQKNKYTSIMYQSGNEPGDAILDEAIIVEITTAQHEKQYLVTQDLLKHGYAFSPKGINSSNSNKLPTKTKPYVYDGEEHVDDLARYIFKAIKRKQKKNYPQGSILIVSFESSTLLLGEDYSHLKEQVSSYDKGVFSKIYLVESGITRKWQPKWSTLL